MQEILPDYEDPIKTSNGTDIIEYTRLLMMEAGLDMNRWRAELFGGKRWLGQCACKTESVPRNHPDEGIIKISAPWYVTLGIEGMLEHAEDEFEPHALEDTIRHEIAHALSIERFGIKHGGGHGKNWKKFARRVHAIPERCAKNLPTRLIAAYKRQCSNCHTVYKWLHQYSERSGIYHCTKCDAPARLSVLEVVENEECVI